MSAATPDHVTLRHVSDVDTWGGPDRSYYEFVVISVLLGLVGGDHIYLRSFKTAGLKALVNLFTFGSWYWWDLIQIFTDGTTVKTEGLSSPLDWIRNIGRGVFVDKAKDPNEYVSQKSYITFVLCSVFLGIFAADKFYMGDYIAGIAKIVLCLNIFTFLIGWLWAAYDAWNAVFSEKEILEHGIPGLLLPRVSGEVFKLKPKREGGNAIVASVLGSVGLSEDSGIGGAFAKWIRWILCVLGLSSEKKTCEPPTYVPPTAASSAASSANNPKESANAKDAKESVKESANESAIATGNANKSTIPMGKPNESANAKESAKESVNESANATEEDTRKATTQRVEFAPTQRGGAYVGNETVQEGGPSNARAGEGGPSNARAGEGGPGPVVAGALTAVVIAAGLKSTYDFISQQYQ